MVLHVGQDIEVDKNRQIAIFRRAVLGDGIVLVPIRPQTLLRGRMLDFAKLDFVVHEFSFTKPRPVVAVISI
jgi:hypothetical protein